MINLLFLSFLFVNKRYSQIINDPSDPNFWQIKIVLILCLHVNISLQFVFLLCYNKIDKNQKFSALCIFFPFLDVYTNSET